MFIYTFVTTAKINNKIYEKLISRNNIKASEKLKNVTLKYYKIFPLKNLKEIFE